MHQPDSILVCQCGSKHCWGFCYLDFTNAGSQLVASASPTKTWFDDGIRSGRLVGFPFFRSFSLLTANSVCVTSILRMTTLESGSKAKDQIYGTFTSTVWTTIEANTGIICACLPMLNGSLSRFFPRLCLRGTKGSTSRGEEAIPHQSKASPANFDSWGRFGGEKPMPTQLTSIASPPRGHRSSDEEIFGMDVITKTTDIRVEYGEKRPPASSSTHDKDSMTITHSTSPKPYQYGFS